MRSQPAHQLLLGIMITQLDHQEPPMRMLAAEALLGELLRGGVACARGQTRRCQWGEGATAAALHARARTGPAASSSLAAPVPV